MDSAGEVSELEEPVQVSEPQAAKVTIVGAVLNTRGNRASQRMAITWRAHGRKADVACQSNSLSLTRTVSNDFLGPSARSNARLHLTFRVANVDTPRDILRSEVFAVCATPYF